MIRMFQSDVEAATALAPPEVVNELLMLGFSPVIGIDVVSQNRIGNLLAMAREQDDVVAFVALTEHGTTTFGTLQEDGGVLFTSNAPNQSVAYPRVRYVSQKMKLPIPELLEQHLSDVSGRAEPGHMAPVFAMALQRRHAEINEARRGAAQTGLYIINMLSGAVIVATGIVLGLVLIPEVQNGLDPSVLVIAGTPAIAVALFAASSNFGRSPHGRPLTQSIGISFGARLPERSLDEVLALGDKEETSR